jgi:hypothetical protein
MSREKYNFWLWLDIFIAFIPLKDITAKPGQLFVMAFVADIAKENAISVVFGPALVVMLVMPLACFVHCCLLLP